MKQADSIMKRTIFMKIKKRLQVLESSGEAKCKIGAGRDVCEQETT